MASLISIPTCVCVYLFPCVLVCMVCVSVRTCIHDYVSMSLLSRELNIIARQGSLLWLQQYPALLYPWHIPLPKCSFLRQPMGSKLEEHGRPPVMWCNILGVFSHTLVVLRAMIRTSVRHYTGIPTSRVSVFKLGLSPALMARSAQVYSSVA